MNLPFANDLGSSVTHTSTFYELVDAIVQEDAKGNKHLKFLLKLNHPMLHAWELKEFLQKGYSISFSEEPPHSNFYGSYEIRWDGRPTTKTVLDYYNK